MPQPMEFLFLIHELEKNQGYKELTELKIVSKNLVTRIASSFWIWEIDLAIKSWDIKDNKSGEDLRASDLDQYLDKRTGEDLDFILWSTPVL